MSAEGLGSAASGAPDGMRYVASPKSCLRELRGKTIARVKPIAGNEGGIDGFTLVFDDGEALLVLALHSDDEGGILLHEVGA